MTQDPALNSDLHCIVYSVFPDKTTAEKIAMEIIDKGLAACANVFQGHQAIYIWAGKQEKAAEVAVLFKTTKTASELVMKEIKLRHPYETPAILSWPITGIDPKYSKWISETVKA
jgi:periplasmic divalent cation tolerance protein